MGADTSSDTSTETISEQPVEQIEQVEQAVEQVEQDRSPQSETELPYASRQDAAVEPGDQDETDDSTGETWRADGSCDSDQVYSVDPEQAVEMERISDAKEEYERKASVMQALGDSGDAGQFFGDLAAGAVSIEMADRQDDHKQDDTLNSLHEGYDAEGGGDAVDMQSIREVIDPDGSHEAGELFVGQGTPPEAPEESVSEAVDEVSGLLLAAGVFVTELVRRGRGQ